MKFLMRNYENTSLDYRFIRAIGVPVKISNLNRENEKRDVIHLVDPASLCV